MAVNEVPRKPNPTAAHAANALCDLWMVSTGARARDVWLLAYFKAYIRACNNFECINLVQIIIEDSLKEAEEVAEQLKGLAEDQDQSHSTTNVSQLPENL